MRRRSTRNSLVAGALLASVLGGPLVHGAAAAPPDAGTPAATSSDASDAGGRPVVEQQSGLLIEAASTDPRLPVTVSLYENTRYGSYAQVIVGDPGEDLIGSVEQPDPFVVDGRVELTVLIDGEPAQLSGTVVRTGTTRVVEPAQDAGEQTISKGTHALLDTDLQLTYGGVTVDLRPSTAFSFDLEVRRVRLYGN